MVTESTRSGNTGGHGAGRDIGGALALGAALYRCRLEQGLSLRCAAQRLGFSSHSGLLDYERGRRIPPESLVAAYEREFGIARGRLQELRTRALRERAEAKVGDLIDQYGRPPTSLHAAPGAPLAFVAGSVGLVGLVSLVVRVAGTAQALAECMATTVRDAWRTTGERQRVPAGSGRG